MEQELPKIESEKGELFDLKTAEPVFDPGCQHELELEEFDGQFYSYKCKKCPRGILAQNPLQA